LAERFRQTIPPEQRLDLPVVSAGAIIEQAKDYPLAAAFACRNGFYLLETGHQRQLRYYIAAAYAITCSIRDSERHLKLFASDVRDGRSKTPPSAEKVKGNLLQRAFRVEDVKAFLAQPSAKQTVTPSLLPPEAQLDT